MAKASQRVEIDEDDLVGKAASESPDKFAGTVRRYEQQRSDDDGVSRLEHQRSRRFARIRTATTDGMKVIYGRFDPITGALIETALSQKMNELWREEDPQARRTPGPADGRCPGGVGHQRRNRRRRKVFGSEVVADRRLRHRLP